MAPSLRRLLLGSPRRRARWPLELLAVVSVFTVVFAGYALGFFEISGGVVFLAGDAALVGLLAGIAVGYLRRGLLLSWLVVYAALLGYSADHYFLGLSGRSLAERAIAFLGPDGLAFLAVEALVIGTVAWLVGTLASLAVEFVRGSDSPLSPE